MSQDHCPKTNVPRPLSQDHCPKTNVPRPMSQDQCPKANVPRLMSQNQCPKTTVPRPMSQDQCPKTNIPRLFRTKTALVQDCSKTALSQDYPKSQNPYLTGQNPNTDPPVFETLNSSQVSCDHLFVKIPTTNFHQNIKF